MDGVRELLRALALVANEHGRRIALIPNAERLRVEAANALLKTLEEPPAGAVLLLVTSSAEALPRTLRSRTLRVRFRPFAEAAIAAELEAEGMSAADAALASRLGGASPAAARPWAEEGLEPAREMAAVLEQSDTLTTTEVLDFAETFRASGEAGRARAKSFIEVETASRASGPSEPRPPATPAPRAGCARSSRRPRREAS